MRIVVWIIVILVCEFDINFICCLVFFYLIIFRNIKSLKEMFESRCWVFVYVYSVNVFWFYECDGYSLISLVVS